MTTAQVAQPEDSLVPVSVVERAGQVVERIRHSAMFSITLGGIFVEIFFT